MNKHPLIGKILADDYHVDSFLGKGGMGMVFVGEQLSLNRKVVIKLLPTFDLSSEEACRFEAEIAAMATLCHPNIVTIYHRGKFGNPPTLYYVMEFLEGGSLKDYLKEYGKLLISTAIRLIRQVAEGLAYAHEQGCVHRDIKPDNLLFNRNYRILKIADFGIAKQTNVANITHSQNMVGTLLYAAPEQMHWFEKRPDGTETIIDGRADQYSLGMVLYEMLTGRLPYQARNFFEMLKALDQDPLPIATALGHPLPKSVEWLVNTMTAKDRESRFLNDEALLEAITEVEMEQASSTSTRVFAINKSDEMIQVPPPQFKNIEPASHSQKMFIQNLKTMDCSPQELLQKELKKRYLTMAGIATGVLFVCIILFLLLKPSPPPPRVFVKYNVSYDIVPPQDYPKLQVFARNTQDSQTVELPQHLFPGQYQLAVVLPGYICREHGKEFTFSLLPNGVESTSNVDLHLSVLSRKVSSQILNQKNNQMIVPVIFKIAEKDVTTEEEFRPGTYSLYARFQHYHTIEENLSIPVGTGVFQYATFLHPLREINPVFQPIQYPYSQKVSLKIFADQKELFPEHYNYQEKEWLFISIRIPENCKVITVRWGYYYESWQIEQSKSSTNRSFSQIDANLLLEHLERCQSNPDYLIEMLTFLWEKEANKLQSIPSDQQKKIYDWLVQYADFEDLQTLQAIQVSPIWQLRQLLNSEEAKEWNIILQSISLYSTMTSRERMEIVGQLLKRFPNSGYKGVLQSLYEYNGMVVKYENEFISKIQDGVYSISEKRAIDRLEKNLQPEDIKKVHDNIRIYLKEKKIGRTLEELLKD